MNKPGDQLRRLLKHFGFNYSRICQCDSIRKRMNDIGSEGCRIEENLNNIIFRIGREAHRRGSIFSKYVCKLLILRACHLAEKYSENENFSASEVEEGETPKNELESAKKVWEDRPKTKEDEAAPSPAPYFIPKTLLKESSSDLEDKSPLAEV